MISPHHPKLPPLNLKTPGLFITATGTDIGKTVATCAIAAALTAQGKSVAVSKPIASGCRTENDQLVNEDAEALKHFSVCRETLKIINPVRFAPPVAPAVAAELEGVEIDYPAIADSLGRLDNHHDALIVEGVGGLMVPLDNDLTVLDLAIWLNYPVLVVVDPQLGTLSNTALTCKTIRDANLSLAGIVINRFDPETADLAQQHNPTWLAKQNNTSIVATLPNRPDTQPHLGRIHPDILAAASEVDWAALCHSQN